MNTTDEYVEEILAKLSSLEVVTAKRMFGGYVFHMAGKVLGFAFDGEFLFEPGPVIDKLLPDAERKELFPGSKLFVVIDESISAYRLCELAKACYDDFPISKPRRKAGSREQEANRRKEIEKRFPFSKNIKW